MILKFQLVWLAPFLMVFATAAGTELPAQFEVWGSRGIGLSPAAEGWVETRAEPITRTAPEPTEPEAAQGFIVFQRHSFTPIYHDTVPAAFERAVKLETFAAQGQYEPLSFALYALVALKEVRVTVSELTHREGAAIPASHIDVRIVMPVRSAVSYGNTREKRFSLVPFYLEKRDRFDIARGKTAQLWLTAKIPQNAKEGDYAGQVRIEVGGKLFQEIPMLIRVLPFTLPSTPIETAISYYPPADLALQEKEMIDQREHGINAHESALAAQVVSRDQHFGKDDLEATRQSLKTGLSLRKKVYGTNANRFPATVEVGHQILYDWDAGKGWFKFWPRSSELETDFLQAVTVCQESIEAEGGPPMRLFIMDEPGGHPDTLLETLFYYKLLKEKRPGLQTYVTLGGGLALGIDELGLLDPYSDLITVNRFDHEIAQRLAERHKPYGLYNGGGATEAVTGYSRDRYFYGFYCWKTGAREILQWVYRFGEPWRDPIRGNHGYVMPAPDGPLPSICWEGIRAGIDDYRYLDLLWRLITVAKTDPKTVEAAQAGERTALEVLGNIDFKYQPRTGDGTPAPVCATLDKWRWKVAIACMDLLKVTPLEKALQTNSKRPEPLELAEASTENNPIRYGTELLPETGFESSPGPWKMAGQAVSKGGLDHTVAHSGKSSFMLENSPDASGMDVVVCVWGWGGPPPSMTLAAGRTYEFSAFVNASSARPQIRVALPEGSIVREKEGEDPAERSGWRRLWRRVTLRKDTPPGYLAVWLQGPGKIWADDLSLREVILPAFVLEAEQALIDGSDKALTVRITQPGSAEISVKVHPPAGGTPRLIKVPPQGEALIELELTGLPIGRYELKAELANPSDPPYAVTLPLTRILGPFDRLP